MLWLRTVNLQSQETGALPLDQSLGQNVTYNNPFRPHRAATLWHSSCDFANMQIRLSLTGMPWHWPMCIQHWHLLIPLMFQITLFSLKSLLNHTLQCEFGMGYVFMVNVYCLFSTTVCKYKIISIKTYRSLLHLSLWSCYFCFWIWLSHWCGWSHTDFSPVKWRLSRYVN